MNLFDRDRDRSIPTERPRKVPGGARPIKHFNLRSTPKSLRRGQQGIRNRYAAIHLFRKLVMKSDR